MIIVFLCIFLIGPRVGHTCGGFRVRTQKIPDNKLLNITIGYRGDLTPLKLDTMRRRPN